MILIDDGCCKGPVHYQQHHAVHKKVSWAWAREPIGNLPRWFPIQVPAWVSDLVSLNDRMWKCELELHTAVKLSLLYVVYDLGVYHSKTGNKDSLRLKSFLNGIMRSYIYTIHKILLIDAKLQHWEAGFSRGICNERLKFNSILPVKLQEESLFRRCNMTCNEFHESLYRRWGQGEHLDSL